MNNIINTIYLNGYRYKLSIGCIWVNINANYLKKIWGVIKKYPALSSDAVEYTDYTSAVKEDPHQQSHLLEVTWGWDPDDWRP